MKVAAKTFLALFLAFLAPFLWPAERTQVRTIQSPDDLPEAFCTIWEKDDILVADGAYLILFGGTPRKLRTLINVPTADAMGSIISFVPSGKGVSDDLNIGSPVIKTRNRTEYVSYSSLRQVKDKETADTIFEARASYRGKEGEKADVVTTYRYEPGSGKIDISSTLVNTENVEFADLSYSLYFTANHVYSFNPYHREKHPRLNFRVYPKKNHHLGWISLNPVEQEGKPLPGKLRPGEKHELRYILLVDQKREVLLGRIYRILGIEYETAFFHFRDFDGKIMELVVRDVFSSAVFFRSFIKRPLSLEIPLPPGAYSVRGNFFPAVAEDYLLVQKNGENSCSLKAPPLGTVNVKIKDRKGEFVPGKVTFLGIDPAKNPYFEPENPVETGKSWESFKNSVFPGEDGEILNIPAGTYLVYASRGPEYSLDQKIIEIFKEETLELLFIIDKVVETPGLISLDPHLHTQYSDGTILVPERLKSVVAEGVEAAVASDHNFITNYSYDLKRFGLNKFLAVIAGNEITTPKMIHFNAYPLEIRSEEENNGAIYPLADEVSSLFEASRRKEPGSIIQVNHPRAGTLGYFNNHQLDLESAASALVHFDMSFDLLEIMNGPTYFSSNFTAIEDWLNLLNRGYFFPLVGSSDSHSIDGGEPGYSRTYVFYEGEKGDQLDWNSLASALKKGKSFTSNGPIIDFRVNRTYSSGDTFTAKGGKIDVWFRVRSAPWVAVDEVRIIVNGERKISFPVKGRDHAVLKCEEEISLNLKSDAYLALEVFGRKSLYPVVQRPSRSGLMTEAALPYALTNPVFIDIDGNEKFDPPLPREILFKEEASPTKRTVPRY